MNDNMKLLTRGNHLGYAEVLSKIPNVIFVNEEGDCWVYDNATTLWTPNHYKKMLLRMMYFLINALYPAKTSEEMMLLPGICRPTPEYLKNVGFMDRVMTLTIPLLLQESFAKDINSKRSFLLPIENNRVFDNNTKIIRPRLASDFFSYSTLFSLQKAPEDEPEDAARVFRNLPEIKEHLTRLIWDNRGIFFITGTGGKSTFSIDFAVELARKLAVDHIVEWGDEPKMEELQKIAMKIPVFIICKKTPESGRTFEIKISAVEKLPKDFKLDIEALISWAIGVKGEETPEPPTPETPMDAAKTESATEPTSTE